MLETVSRDLGFSLAAELVDLVDGVARFGRQSGRPIARAVEGAVHLGPELARRGTVRSHWRATLSYRQLDSPGPDPPDRGRVRCQLLDRLERAGAAMGDAGRL